MEVLTARNISYRYPGREQTIIGGFSCNLEKGHTYRVCGRNGSGKSTLLKLFAGVLTPVEGTITHTADTSYLNQDANACSAEHLTVYEQLCVGGMQSDENINAQIRSYEVGLEHMVTDFVSELSGGQRQIITLLSILAQPGLVVCLDEFMSAMDPISVQTTIKILETETKKNGLTIVYVSHLGQLFDDESQIMLT